MKDEPQAANRAEYIAMKVRVSLEALAQDALQWGDTPSDGLNFEPLWYELRDAIVSELFDMEREMVKEGIDSAYVYEHCL